MSLDIQEYFDSFTERDWQTTREGTVRLALVGLGWWTIDEAIPAIELAEHCEVTTVISGSKEKAERVAGETDGIEAGLTYDEFHGGVGADAYDAVYLATPNAFHLEYVETAAELGKAVLCEKPMESTVERAERLVEVCEAHDVTLMIAYRMHTEPAVRRMRDCIQKGFIGKPVTVYGNNTQQILELIDDPNQWRLNPDLSGYGTSLMDLGIYPLNTTRFLLREDPVSVQAQMESFHPAFGDVPDERAACTAVYESGVHAVFTASQNAYDDTELKITGTEGQLTLSPAFHLECGLTLERNGVSAEITFENVNEMTEEFDYFADRVLSGEPVYADGTHGVVDMKTIRALHESSESGETVALE